MKGLEMLIVPGTGLLTDAYGLHAGAVQPDEIDRGSEASYAELS
jgi:hypothetical protein